MVDGEFVFQAKVKDRFLNLEGEHVVFLWKKHMPVITASLVLVLALKSLSLLFTSLYTSFFFLFIFNLLVRI